MMEGGTPPTNTVRTTRPQLAVLQERVKRIRELMLARERAPPPPPSTSQPPPNASALHCDTVRPMSSQCEAAPLATRVAPLLHHTARGC
jgi:hypothetical protein